MGFLYPFALLALPLSLLPFWLEWRGLRTGQPVRFSSVYLLERARRIHVPRLPTRSRWVALLRALAILLLVTASARPLGCGSGDAASHRPTRAIVAVDVSASAGQIADGVAAWTWIRTAADSLLAAASPEDRIALAAVADGIVGWWEAPAPALRARLAELGPGDRPSDWPRALAALDSRIDEDTEAYLLTDGSSGAVPPGPAPEAERTGYKVVIVVRAPATGNRGLVSADWISAGDVSLAGKAWGNAPVAAEAGRGIGAREEVRPIALDGAAGSSTWEVADTATFGFREPDALPADDRIYVARRGIGNQYEIVRWIPGDEPPESGPLFWEAALEALPGAADVGRAGTLSALAVRAPELALLPIRNFAPGEVTLLEDLAAAGTRVLFSPACGTPACVPPPGWLPARGTIAVPDLRLEEREAGSPLTGRPAGSRAIGVPEPLLDRAPIRGGFAPGPTPAPDWTWDLGNGRPALWVRGMVAVWLVPLGPPHTNLATTPVFPLVAGTALDAWDPRWSSGGAGSRVGERIRGLPPGATVTGPLHAGDDAGTWEVPDAGDGPAVERAGIYRVRDPAGGTIFVAVNGDPAEGDLTRVPPAAWEAAWGAAVAPVAWRGALFPRRRGPELWPWALVLAVLALAAEAAVRRARLDD